MSESKTARTRNEILEDELVETQELITALFIERDIAMELQDVEEADKQYSYIKPLIKRRAILKKMIDVAKSEGDKMLEIAQMEKEGISFIEFPATIYIRNHYFSETS